LRVVATVAVDTLTLPKLGLGGRSNPTEAELYRRRTVFDNGEALETPRYSREKLLADDTVAGPALVIQHNSTTLVPPGYVATILEYGDMLIVRNSGRPA
jgi:N-methylhydantoinase A